MSGKGLRAPEPNHALTGIRRIGTVNSAAAGPPPTVNIYLGGDAGTPMDVPYLESYSPQAGDRVVVLSVQGDHIVLGAVAAAAGMFIQAGTVTRSWTTIASESGTITFPVAFNTVPVCTATVAVGSNFDVLWNWTGAATVTTQSWRMWQRSLSNITATVLLQWHAIGT